MPSAPGIPIGYVQVRSVRAQHSQVVVNVPKEFARALGITPGEYVEFTRYSDGSLRLRRYAPRDQVHAAGVDPATSDPR